MFISKRFSQLGRGLRWLLASSLVAAAPARALSATPAPAPTLEFVQNKGQWASPVRYAAALPAGRLFAQATSLTYVFVDPAGLPQHGGHAAETAELPHVRPGRLAAHAYTVSFEKASPQASLTAEQPTAEVRNYFVGSDERHWASQVGSFRQLRYTGVWPGIDLHFYENAQQQLEYDLRLAPHANPARIALRYNGAEQLSLDAAGNLVLRTTVRTVTERAPRAWQLDDQGRQQAVPCRYRLRHHTVSFELGRYDHQRALVIDPVVTFSSYTGSTGDNWGFTATYDQEGNMYSGGITLAPGFPTSNGAFDTQFSALCDIALIKYNTRQTGQAARAWATYLGGSEAEFPQSLVTNAQNELVVLGSTSSLNFPTTTGALSRQFGGGFLLEPFAGNEEKVRMNNGADLTVTRFSASGGSLRASTYLGGSGNDGVLAASSPLAANYGDSFRSDVLLDGAGNVYVASNTNSSNFPGLSSGFNATYRGGPSDGVVCCLPPALNTVTWAGLLGGTGTDAVHSIQRDAQGRVYVAGGTNASLPATAGAYQRQKPGGIDGFVARISANGSTLERLSYAGTSAYDQAYFVQLDAVGNAYLFGQTQGTYPRTAGLYGTTGGTSFIQKLDPDLTTSLYSTTVGAAGGGSRTILVPSAFLVDECERIYICGWGGEVNAGNLGGSTNGLPVTPGALNTTGDGSDFYLAEFTPGLRGLNYGTFFGQMGGRGEHVDGGTSRFDRRGVVYQAVCASCGSGQGFPMLAGAGSFSTRNGSMNCNNAAFRMDFQVPQADPGPRRAVCLDSGPVTLAGSPAGGTWAGPGVSAAGSGYQFVPTAVGPGQYLLTYTVATTGICQSTRQVRYTVAPPITPVFSAVPAQCVTGTVAVLQATPAGGTFSGPGVTGLRFDPQAAGPGSHTLTYAVRDSLGCGTATQQVTVAANPVIRAGRDTTLCADQTQPFQLAGFNPAGGTWSGTGVSAGGFFTPPATNNRGGIFELTYTVVQPPCRSTATRRVVLAPASGSNVPLRLPVCERYPQFSGFAPFDCPLAPLLPGGTYVWDFGDGSPTSTEATPTHRYEQAGTYQLSLKARYADCEVLTQFAPLEVGEVQLPNIITPNGDGKNDSFRPRCTCVQASLKIFSRWGQSVFATDDYHNDWQGEGVPAGLYYYLLRDVQGRTVKGWVEVVK